jgi:DNA-binding NtrC family response regulator
MKDTRWKLLVIDDDDIVIQSIRMCLPENWSLTASNTLADISSSQHFDAAFIDLHLTGDISKPEGLKVVKTLHERDPHLEIVSISGDLNRDLMEACLKAGASRFLAKPLTKEEIHLLLDKIEALLLLKGAAHRPRKNLTQWIGTSSASNEIRKRIASLRGESGPILIDAESGAGKEVTARIIHEQESSERPFISVNVAALPDTLFESELFGHVRGAFTGADQNKMGLAEAAHGGDLFLDEIEALPLHQQPKLLRFLESGEIRRVGSKETIKINVRVIAATNQNLNKLVKEENFREDLLYRLSGKKLILPPLRERKEDIAELAKYFIDMEKPRRNKSLAGDAVESLQSYDWPGNVRELRRVCEQLCLQSPLPIIRAEDVRMTLPSLAPTAAGKMEEIDLSMGLDHLLARYEATVIRHALLKKSDIDETAKLLGISRSSLYKKIKDYNIEVN